MESELVVDRLSNTKGEVANTTSPLPYTRIFKEQLPFYLSIGMTYDQFYNDDVELVVYYRKAFDLKRDRENTQMWLQGMYIYEALLDVSPVLHAFAKKGTKPVPYSTEPYPLTEKQIVESKERKEQVQVEKVRAKLNAWAKKTNSTMKTR